MPYLLLVLLVLAIVFGPSLWAKTIMARHAGDRQDFPGTGGELARHLLDEAGLQGVGVEVTALGDHYDPTDRVVRLTKPNHDGRSLTAVVVAAHEVGHALQHRDAYAPLVNRHRLVKATALFQRLGSVIALTSPFWGLISRSPLLTLGVIGIGVLSMASAVVVHLATLPVGNLPAGLSLDGVVSSAEIDLVLEEAGHFVQEWGEPVARAALARFGR